MNILLVVLVALIASCMGCKDSASTPDGGAQVAADGGGTD